MLMWTAQGLSLPHQVDSRTFTTSGEATDNSLASGRPPCRGNPARFQDAPDNSLVFYTTRTPPPPAFGPGHVTDLAGCTEGGLGEIMPFDEDAAISTATVRERP